MSPGRESARPYYGSYAWAYDQLNERPVADECAYVAATSTSPSGATAATCVLSNWKHAGENC